MHVGAVYLNVSLPLATLSSAEPRPRVQLHNKQASADFHAPARSSNICSGSSGRRRDNGPCYPLFELFIFFTFPSFPSRGTRLSPSSLMFSLSLDCHSHCPPGAGNAG